MTSGRMTMAGTLWRCVACRFHHWLRATALLSGLAFSSAVLADSPGESRACKLAPGDRITVSVVGQAELSGDMLPDERVRQPSFQKRALAVRRARLEAQRDGKNTVSLPALPGSTQENENAETVAIEKETLDSQARILQKQLELLRAQKPRIQNEIEFLNAQTATTKKQLEIVKQHADQYSRLVKQGLGLANAELQLRLTEATQESELWRLEVQISRLQMDSSVLDLQIDEAEAIFKRQIITELRDVGERLKELDVVLPVAREIREVRLAQAGSLAGAETARSISVTRTRNGEVTSFQATETRPWSPATSSMSIGCFPASCATRALRPGNLVYKIIKCERQPARSAGWLPASS